MAPLYRASGIDNSSGIGISGNIGIFILALSVFRYFVSVFHVISDFHTVVLFDFSCVRFG